MDAILVNALTTTPEGAAFTQATTSDSSSRNAWQTFTAVLNSSYRARLSEAATDETAKGALSAFDSYIDAQERLANGSITEFADPVQAQADLKAGREPQRNPDYIKTVETYSAAHTTLSECMPHWPVLF